MELTVLGSGGNTPIPMPTCTCNICRGARRHGMPYTRLGNSTFIHDINALIDTPEAVWHMLNRENIKEVDYIFLSHHHFDHVLGLRVLQPLGIANQPFTTFSAEEQPAVVMGEATHDILQRSWSAANNLLQQWTDEVIVLSGGDTLHIDDTEVEIIGAEIEPGNDHEIFSFCFKQNGETAVISPDETKFLDLDTLPSSIDVWVKECGLFRETPGGTPLMEQELWEEETRREITFNETLGQINTVTPRQTVLTEIEHIYQRSYDDYEALEKKYEDLNLRFGYDGMQLSV